MPSLPTGTVTFLFTDIEGSTYLLEQLGDRYGHFGRGARNPIGYVTKDRLA
jgi:hypothetical protein